MYWFQCSISQLDSETHWRRGPFKFPHWVVQTPSLDHGSQNNHATWWNPYLFKENVLENSHSSGVSASSISFTICIVIWKQIWKVSSWYISYHRHPKPAFPFILFYGLIFILFLLYPLLYFPSLSFLFSSLPSLLSSFSLPFVWLYLLLVWWWCVCRQKELHAGLNSFLEEGHRHRS